MKSIAAREIKRRGIGAFDDLLTEGPLYIIKKDEPRYVLMTSGQYEELLEDQEEATVARVRESLADVEAGRVRYVTVADLMEGKPADG